MTTSRWPAPPALQPGDRVERRFGRGGSRNGRISSRVTEGYDTWYVVGEDDLIYCDNGIDLRQWPAGPNDWRNV
jgi:hypothetical protein